MHLTVRTCLAAATLFASLGSAAQTAAKDTSWKTNFRTTPTIINDLVHTKIEASFDYTKSQMPGKVWITLQPHFYNTDSLTLDAKGMDIKEVKLVKATALQPLNYKYDGMKLRINLGRTFTRNEKYTVYVNYVAKPNDLTVKGSAAINDAKGLYFIDPMDTDPEKPTQIWTQGETEATSVWCPTIDHPAMKTTQETIMTVPGKYVTLSNGKLVNQQKNKDGTRTDTWKMDLPHAPYLFFMGVGDFAVVKDTYKGKEVNYYVEKEYAAVARRIFGDTPAMMAYFSKITGVEYPWIKYSQMTARDYVSGAMENTTATLHQESAQQDARQLADGNGWESTIAHELFHQWFGDLVTAENWSNLTLNESFANYSEYLWYEYKYGRDKADAHNFDDMRGYLQSGSDKKNLVRYYYADKEDMFDAVSYNKGGRILHMLRTYVGDSAFFKALNVYLTTNKFKSAEAGQLRLAFEQVTGEDMNWFWNQWYFGSGHPKLSTQYEYNDAAGQGMVVLKQTQTGNAFVLPLDIDVYEGASKTRYRFWMREKTDTFRFMYKTHPSLVNVDATKTLLTDKKDNKSLAELAHQYKYAGLYMDRKEAIEAAVKKQDDASALQIIDQAVNDRYDELQAYTISKLDIKKPAIANTYLPAIQKALSSKSSDVRAAALQQLVAIQGTQAAHAITKALNDSSYTVAGTALELLSEIDESKAIAEAKRLSAQPSKGRLQSAISGTLISKGTTADFDAILKLYNGLAFGQEKFELTPAFLNYLKKIDNLDQFKSGVDAVLNFKNSIPSAYREQTDGYFINLLNGLLKSKESASGTVAKEQAAYLKSKL